MKIPVICIDGPTASGKGMLASEIARQLGFNYLDSGALYRILGFVARRHGLSLDATNEMQIASFSEAMLIRFEQDGVFVDGEDIGEFIRSEQAGMDASLVAVLPKVRTALLDLQRDFRRSPGLVADGRDIGTVVFPDSALKIFLTASAAHRAERRYRQLLARGINASFESLRSDLEARDARDVGRSTAPLIAAEDAWLLDNSNLTVQESVALVLGKFSALAMCAKS